MPVTRRRAEAVTHARAGATRRIKSDPALRSIPIIAVTSYALGGDEAKGRAAGCDAYVTKPYSPRQLLARIRELLR